jgi:tRNA (cmo5U34)-methyltransferase
VSERGDARTVPTRETFWQNESAVADYLGPSREAVPLASEQLDVMVRVIRAFGSSTRVVLDLGAGDGAMADAVGRAFPVERVTLVDSSPPMLQEARNRFTDSSFGVDIIEADFHEQAWIEQISAEAGPFGVVVSRFAIHHVPDERKQELFREILSLMEPGGAFVNIEHVASPSQVFTDLFDGLIAEGIAAVSEPPLAYPEALRAYHERYNSEVNYLAPVDSQCRWLRESGFLDVDVVMKLFEIAVIVARKPVFA